MPRWGASVFHVLWLGHMYMGSKGLPMHSSRSLVYGKTLAHCTCAVYPPRFLWTMPRWEASLFRVLWLGHMYMASNGLLMNSSQSLIYGETLARCTCAVYFPRFLRTTPRWGASVFHVLWLGHMYIGNSLGGSPWCQTYRQPPRHHLPRPPLHKPTLFLCILLFLIC
jgi:hypothetical protein